MKLFVSVLIFFAVFSSFVFAEPEVQMSVERDAKGKFINPAALGVSWEKEADGTYKQYAEADVPDSYSTDDDTLQEWYVPKPKTSGVYWKFSFTRRVKGEYAVRWRPTADALWSKWESCTITKTRPPQKGA